MEMPVKMVGQWDIHFCLKRDGGLKISDRTKWISKKDFVDIFFSTNKQFEPATIELFLDCLTRGTRRHTFYVYMRAVCRETPVLN